MNSKKMFLAIAMLSIGLSAAVMRAQFPPAAFERAQVPPTPPDLSGIWTLVDGDPSLNSPLGREGSIVREGSALIFRSSAQSLTVPFDGSKTTRSDRAFNWEYQGRWEGVVALVSMRATSGATPANFVDLMVLSPSAADTLTVVMLRTSIAQEKVMHTGVMTYRKKT